MVKSYMFCVVMFLVVSPSGIFASLEMLPQFIIFTDNKAEICVTRYSDCKKFIVNDKAHCDVPELRNLFGRFARRCLVIKEELFESLNDNACIVMYKGNYSKITFSDVKETLQSRGIQPHHIVSLDVYNTRIARITQEDMGGFCNLQWLRLVSETNHIDASAFYGTRLAFLDVRNNKLSDLAYAYSLINRPGCIWFGRNSDIANNVRRGLCFASMFINDYPQLFNLAMTIGKATDMSPKELARIFSDEDVQAALRIQVRQIGARLGDMVDQLDPEYCYAINKLNLVDRYRILLVNAYGDSKTNLWYTIFNQGLIGRVDTVEGPVILGNVKNFFIKGEEPLILKMTLDQFIWKIYRVLNLHHNRVIEEKLAIVSK